MDCRVKTPLQSHTTEATGDTPEPPPNKDSKYFQLEITYYCIHFSCIYFLTLNFFKFSPAFHAQVWQEVKMLELFS